MVNTPSAGINNEPVHCFIAIELSKSGCVVGFQTPLSDKTSRYQVKAGDANGLLELIERVRTRVIRHLSRPIEMMLCYGAGYDGFWLHRVLESHGIHNHVLDLGSLQVNRRARRPKTDRIDADRKVCALIHHLRGEPEACSVVRVPSIELEDAKRLHRERRRLITDYRARARGGRGNSRPYRDRRDSARPHGRSRRARSGRECRWSDSCGRPLKFRSVK
jgi:transposase